MFVTLRVAWLFIYLLEPVHQYFNAVVDKLISIVKTKPEKIILCVMCRS